MTSSLPNFAATPASTGAAPLNAASVADFGTAGSNPQPGDFADLLSDSDAASECVATATATPSFTILGPTFFTLLAPSSAESAEVAALPEIPVEEETFLTPAGISRDTMEQAASLLATIFQSVLPETLPPAVPTGLANTAPTSTARRDAGPPGGDILAGTRPCVPGSADQADLAAETPAPDAPSFDFDATLAADGAVEINATLPPGQGSADKSTRAATGTAGAMEIQAELMLPGRAIIRLSASGSPGDAPQGRANFAGRISAGKITVHSPAVAAERNFLVAGKEEVKTDSPMAGIPVAKTESTMQLTPTDETRAINSSETFPGLSARGEFTVAWPSAERMSEPVVAPLEKNFAERAVATVTNLVDTQFTASMQKTGSVQLHLKFGGEDLSVRVELRDGAVHTDFRTDSPELRAALNREWQAVAGQSSEALRRFVEPVFSPSSSNGGDASSSFARQQAAQQDLPQHRAPRAHAEDTLNFTRRSHSGESLPSQPAASRSPVLVPTSLRLSVLA